MQAIVQETRRTNTPIIRAVFALWPEADYLTDQDKAPCCRAGRQQEDAIEYLREENRVLREQLGRKRTVRSIKEERLSGVVVLGERPLRLLVRECVEHYHRERNYQGLGNQQLSGDAPPADPDTAIRRANASADSSTTATGKPCDARAD